MYFFLIGRLAAAGLSGAPLVGRPRAGRRLLGRARTLAFEPAGSWEAGMPPPPKTRGSSGAVSWVDPGAYLRHPRAHLTTLGLRDSAPFSGERAATSPTIPGRLLAASSPAFLRISARRCTLGPVPEQALFDELVGLLTERGIEVRVEHFKAPSQRGGGYCKIEGRRTVILDAQASPPQMAQALLEAVEEMGLAELGISGQDLSPALLQRLTRRGRMPWPRLADAPTLRRAGPRDPNPRGTRAGHGGSSGSKARSRSGRGYKG